MVGTNGKREGMEHVYKILIVKFEEQDLGVIVKL
jgi:hypothetical protein